jgi:hypothetical protein
MYGIVNRAIKGLVVENHGLENWEKIKSLCNLEDDLFISNEPYPDELTFELATATSKVLSINIEEVLISFGEYWVLDTGQKTYGYLMKAGGDSFKEFLKNLPNFHSRVMLVFPNLTPPEFKVVEVKPNEFLVHYYSTRDGLTYFMYGLLSGLSKMYNVKTSISIEYEKSKGANHDVFKVIV